MVQKCTPRWWAHEVASQLHQLLAIFSVQLIYFEWQCQQQTSNVSPCNDSLLLSVPNQTTLCKQASHVCWALSSLENSKVSGNFVVSGEWSHCVVVVLVVIAIYCMQSFYVLVFIYPASATKHNKRISQLNRIKIISPPESDSLWSGLKFYPWCFFKIFFHLRNLRDAWADQREILHDSQ